MKPAIFLTLLPLLAALPSATAAPYVVRTVPAGYSAPSISFFGPMEPIAADFMGNGRKQWYQGGNTISRAPEPGVLTLPVLTLPGTPNAIVETLDAAVADVDRDGDPDIIRINQWDGNAFRYTLQVFLNSGTGTFTEGFRHDWTNTLPYDEGDHLFEIQAADFNKDGAVDLAIAETYENDDDTTNPDHKDGKLYIRWNDGTGNYPTLTTLQPDGMGVPFIYPADYDRDGDMDLACTGYTKYGPDKWIGLGIWSSEWTTRSTLLFTNSGSGTFTVGTSGLFENKSLYFQDLNGDSWPELYDGEQYALNNRDGTFASFAAWNSANDPPRDPLSFYPSGADTFTLPAAHTAGGLADADNDGDEDGFYSLADGTFAFVENREMHREPGGDLAALVNLTGTVSALHSADFFLDGTPDVMAVTPATERLWFINGRDDGQRDAALFKNTQSESAHQAVVADFDRDGRPDVAYTLPAAGSVRMARNISDSPFGWTDSAIVTGMAGAAMLTAGEYGTPNGAADLFVCSQTTGQLRGLYQTGGIWNSQTIAGSLSPIPGALDAGQVAASSPGSEIGYLHADASSLTLRASRLSGAWTALGTTRTETVAAGPHAVKFLWAEITGDRLEDGVFINGAGELAIWFPGTNASTALVTGMPRIHDFAATDWDRDGRTDLVCATAGGLGLVHFRRSTNTWMYTSLFKTDTSPGYSCVTVQDFNRDGWPDAVAANPSRNRLEYIRNVRKLMRADFSANPTTVDIPVAGTRTVFTLPVSTAGRTAINSGLADESAAVERCTLVFREAVAGPGGTLMPGAVTPPQGFVTLKAGNTNLLAHDDGNNLNGQFTMGIPAGLPQTFVPVAPGTSITHTLELASYGNDVPRSFFVSVVDIQAARILDGSSDTTDNLEPVLLAESAPVLVNIVTASTPLRQWRQQHFGAPEANGIAANDADADADGVANLVEYATGTNPRSAEPALNAARRLTVLPPANAQSGAGLRLILADTALADPNVEVRIRYSTGLDEWNPYSYRLGGASWILATPQRDSFGGHSTLDWNTSFTPASAARVFFRLEVTEFP